MTGSSAGTAADAAAADAGGAGERKPEYVTLREGMQVRVRGLQARYELNGLVGTLVAISQDTGRWSVDLGIPGRPTRSLKSANLEPTSMDGLDYVVVDHPSAAGKYPLFAPLHQRLVGPLTITVYISRLMELTAEVTVKPGSTILDVRKAVAAQDPLGAAHAEDFGVGLPGGDV
eukprot:CAMPEP_0179296814 /NCGR_PEP_ID=MMETSP0797-20121207/45136_1 /TAXON_ID=47934 /ORGANISM="Dinophysis acuminata, Strain DAEP01" /LENGTH=173 /DNA_ID=CAMNT_0021006111 /DNA_START=112 /DNA_END=629 /DNA_ORIENTATION=+